MVFEREVKRPREITISYLWDAYAAEKEGKRIVSNMEFSGKAVLPFFGHMHPDHITTALCRQYAAKRAKAKRKPGTIWTELNHLRIVTNWARKVRLITEPTAIELPRKPPPRDKRLTRAEARALIDAAEPGHIRLAIVLMLTTAARSGAILDLTWDRVDFERGQIMYADPEDDAHRKGRATVPMNNLARTELEAAQKVALSEYVVEWAGRKVGSIKRGFAASVERAGLSGVTPHILRHTAASLMAESGTPMDEIAQYLGHSDPGITFKVYARFSPGHLKKASAALEF